MKKFFSKPKSALLLYLLAVITLSYTVFTIFTVTEYINVTYIQQYGYTWAEYGKDFILTYIQAIESYVFYTIVFMALGKIICMLDPMYGLPEDFFDEDDYEEVIEETEEK